MAPRFEPHRLYRSSLKVVTSLIDNAAQRLFLEYGTLVSEDCAASVLNLQTFLAESLPTTVFEDLTEIRNLISSSSDECSRFLSPYYKTTFWIQDPRIKLSVYLHPTLTRFSVDSDGNEFLQSQVDGMDEIFWCTQLKRLTNLTRLHLNVITTDEVLRIVGEYCTKVKDINIVSKIREATSPPSPLASENRMAVAFSLRLCVSDVGLEYLSKCKDLRTIVMNKVIPFTPSSSSGITLNGVRRLVQSLPKLEQLNFASMGRILEEGFDPHTMWPLNLKYFWEMKCNVVSIPLLERATPFLKHISITAPFPASGTNGHPDSWKQCNEIFDLLAASKVLLLSVCEFHNFPCSGSAFANFIRSKGYKLEELVLRSSQTVTYKEIKLLGEYCHSLKSLNVRGLQSVRFLAEESSSLIRTGKEFPALTSLTLSGKSWNPVTFLPYILGSALLISKLSFLDAQCRYTLDSALDKVWKTNPLSELRLVMFHTGCYVSFEFLKRMAFNCPKLESLNFLLFSDFDVTDVEELKLDMKKNNYNIRLSCLELDVI